MRGFLLSLLSVVCLVSCAEAQLATGRLGNGLPAGTAAGNGGVLPNPGPIQNISPADQATGVSITPTLSFSSQNALTYFVRIAALGEVGEQINLNTSASYTPTLLNDTAYFWQACALNTTGIPTCSQQLTFHTVAAIVGSPPSGVSVTFPVASSTGVSIAPILRCAATGATSYTLTIGTTNPPSTSHDGGDDCSFQASGLAYSTSYYVQATATNMAGSTPSTVIVFTTQAAPSSSFCARPCTRLLSAAKKAELVTRRSNNTVAWQELKGYVDQLEASAGTNVTTLNGALGTGDTGTTFAVVSAATAGLTCDGATPNRVRTDWEMMTVTCSGNLLTVVSRGDVLYSQNTSILSHASGAELWKYRAVSYEGCSDAGPSLAVMEYAGDTSYEQRARYCLGNMFAAYAPTGSDCVHCERNDGNTVRVGWWSIAFTYDLVRAHLSANEVSWMAPILEDTARWHLAHMKWCISVCPTRQGNFEAGSTANISEGQLRFILAAAADTIDDTATAQQQWDTAYGYVNSYLIPSADHGALSGGNEVEGSAYGNEPYYMTPTILDLIHAATGEDVWARVPTLALNLAKYQLYSIQPGGRDWQAGVYTYGTIAATGDTTMTVLDASHVATGDNIAIVLDGHQYNPDGLIVVDAVTNTDVKPDNYTPVASDVGAKIYFQPLSQTEANFNAGMYAITAIVGGKWRLNASPGAVGTSTTRWAIITSFNTVVMGVSGSTITFRDPAPYKATNGIVTHQATEFSYGDTEGYNNYDDFLKESEIVSSMSAVMDALRTTNATYAGYLRWYIDHVGILYNDVHWNKFLNYDDTIPAVDYTGASLATNYSTAASAAASGSTGMVIGLSGWTKTSNWVNFLVGNEFNSYGFDHATHYANSYAFKRKGVWLTHNLQGYGVQGLHDPCPHYTVLYGIGSCPFVGWRYHNTVALEGAATAMLTNYESNGPAVLSRSDTGTAGYFYGRGDAGDAYRFNNNHARTFRRDFLYIKPDLVAFADYINLSASSASPATWFLQFTGNPSLASQRITATYSTQKAVQDVLLPTGATFTKVDHSSEDQWLQGYHYEVTSGLTTASETFCSSFQGMDSGDTPASVTLLTSTNGCVFEVSNANASCPNSCVIGFVTGASPTLPIVWTYSASAPDSYIFGLATSTAYHITRSTKTVTIAAATGSGDTTSSASGKLAVP